MCDIKCCSESVGGLTGMVSGRGRSERAALADKKRAIAASGDRKADHTSVTHPTTPPPISMTTTPELDLTGTAHHHDRAESGQSSNTGTVSTELYTHTHCI